MRLQLCINGLVVITTKKFKREEQLQERMANWIRIFGGFPLKPIKIIRLT